ncbi:MAG: hypothetical protein N3J91_02945 [Verrucomicrobiae bacterium]|nr:hypothetical protein [Verrucomicrobiae bacterium]
MKVKGRAAQTRRTAKSSGRWRFSPWNGLFLILGIVVAVLWNSLANRKPQPPAPSTNPVAATADQPWGQLEVTPIVIERPEEYFQDDAPVPPLAWHFPGMHPDQLAELLRSLQPPPEWLPRLLDTNHWEIHPHKVILKPPLDLVRDLPPDLRQRLYAELARHPENLTQRYPFVYRADGFDEWFAQSGLSPDTLAALRRMMCQQDHRLCFYDAHYFRLTLPTNEVRALARALSRVPTLIVTLHVPERADVTPLLNYWGSPRRNRNLKPLLESMARAPGGASLNVSYFFPPLAQSLLYTYPHPTNRFMVRAPDCFWTSMNFGRDNPDPRFLDSQYIQTALATEYERIERPTRFGDLILLYEPGQMWRAVHMCVYIADDIVFTKNGADIYQPWVLMRLPDMLIHYPSQTPLQMTAYRRLQPY